MNILSIGYAGFDGSDFPAWQRFARDIFATQARPLAAPDGRQALGLRFDDDYAARFLVTEGENEANTFFGFELADATALEEAADELARAGFSSTAATREELAFRQIEGMRHFLDSDGYRVELFHGPIPPAAPFAPTRPIGGYRMGRLGFGHAVLAVRDMAQARRLYCDAMGFRLSDYIVEPNLRVFLHINGRHHSLALGQRPGHGIAHLMVELNDFDDVGRTYDLVLRDYPDSIYSTLGRHSNDHMVSFYVRTPSGFPVEYGWGGRLVDDNDWDAGEIFGPSLWGHDRIGGAALVREAANRQREHAFETGLRAPLIED